MKPFFPGLFGISVGTEWSTARIHHSEHELNQQLTKYGCFCHAEVTLRHDRDVSAAALYNFNHDATLSRLYVK